MEEKIRRLKAILAEAIDLQYTAALLSWDQQTYMPTLAAEERGSQLATLVRLVHQRVTSDEVGRLLEDLSSESSGLDPDSDDAALIRIAAHDYQKLTHVPEALLSDFAHATTVGQEAWVQARTESNFAFFQPYLERIVDLRRQYAACFQPYEHVYDPLLDDFERGMKVADVQAIFQVLRPQQVEIIRAIADRPQVDDSFLHQEYAETEQWAFGVEVISQFGYDWKRGRQDKSAHPFTISFGLDDVRITTRLDARQPAMAMFGSMHETGHALYELGVNPAYRRTPLALISSLALHESQSRMWENLVGRSLPFWKHYFPRLQERFPSQLGNVDLMTFYRGINKVEPSLIRVEADEATYNLHIMLRLELEIALMEGSLAVKDLPEAWNAHMQSDLGLLPPNDAAGVLQDIHWSGGSIGYFATYALGNLVSAQLWEVIQRAIPDLDAQIEQGQFGALLGWLRENIHQYGGKYDAPVLIERVTGSKIDPQPYLRYLQNKFGAIYGF